MAKEIETSLNSKILKDNLGMLEKHTKYVLNKLDCKIDANYSIYKISIKNSEDRTLQEAMAMLKKENSEAIIKSKEMSISLKMGNEKFVL